jgi:uncharacterized SAM-binding protein YcdF (DUF218 family)
VKPLYVKLGVVLLLLITVWWFRFDILRGIGDYLDDSEQAQPAQRIFVLGGGAYDRGHQAARLWYKGFAPKIICTGNYISGTVKSLDLTYTEAQLTQMRIWSFDIDSILVEAINVGTSTMEESDFILEYCLQNRLDKIILVSDKFHTHRIKNVFEEKFADADIQVIYSGAPSSRYKESEWWREEAGLIMVNNEYIKLGYYWWKY